MLNKNITMDHINEFMNKVSFRTKKGYTNYNYFIVKSPKDEYMVDLIELGFKKVNIIIVLSVLTFCFPNMLTELKCLIKFKFNRNCIKRYFK